MRLKIHTQLITLGQFLKLVGLVSTGGQAKEYIANNSILVNGIAAEQRGKKIYPGDVVRVNNSEYTVTR
ncbi:MAG TPA: S4 domain-containing protein YaaA [Bacillota bacterium]|nr:S4 domain-containing protein YaaA [Bacillota bacterium]